MARLLDSNLLIYADPDGTLHLPLPADLRSSKVKVTATLESAGERPVQVGSKLKALLSAGRGPDGETATARIAEVYEDRQAWRARFSRERSLLR